MVMNFWEAQRRARSKTTIYMVIFALLTISVAILLEFAMRIFAPDQYQSTRATLTEYCRGVSHCCFYSCSTRLYPPRQSNQCVCSRIEPSKCSSSYYSGSPGETQSG